MLDRLNRSACDLRISVTDRCNLRCSYCMPKNVFGPGYEFLERSSLLTYEEIGKVVEVFTGLGIEKIRLTGGEPLMRRNLERLVQILNGVPGVRDVALTTNGVLLPQLARPLAESGLHRVTISLDSLDDAVFRQMNDVGVPVSRVLDGIEAAREAGLGPIKLNCVVRRGVNDRGIVDLARRFKGTGIIVRFIEFMDVGTTNGWRMEEVVPSREIVEMIHEQFPLESAAPSRPGEVARRWRYLDGSGEIGVISSVTQPFCGSCTRARLSADGKLYTCLFATTGVDIRGPLRKGATQEDLRSIIAERWARRDDRYSELRSGATKLRVLPRGGDRIEMSYIGG